MDDGSIFYGLPGGKALPGETLGDAAVRQVLEETPPVAEPPPPVSPLLSPSVAEASPAEEVVDLSQATMLGCRSTTSIIAGAFQVLCSFSGAIG